MARGETYVQFVEKFKPKKTTDDCYTPAAIYDAVRDWAVAEYKLKGREIVRPFWPGGDYVNYHYPPGCVVIDNPSYSQVTSIARFYLEKGIDFFLFAPHLTLFSGNLEAAYIVVAVQIEYENGARVLTSFVTNLDRCRIRSAKPLRDEILRLQSVDTPEIPKYTYPDEVITAAKLGGLVGQGLEFEILPEETHHIRAMDAQRTVRKQVFGAGYLVSTDTAARLKPPAKPPIPARVWRLSEREKEIIGGLGHGSRKKAFVR